MTSPVKQTLDITAFETPVLPASSFGLNRRNAFTDLDYILQQRLLGETEWATVASFNFTVHADTFVAVFRAKYPQAQIDWRLLSLKS